MIRRNPYGLGFHTLDCINGKHKHCTGKAHLSGTVCLCECHKWNWKRAHLLRKAVERRRLRSGR